MSKENLVKTGKCPHCQKEITMNVTAVLAEKQTITITLESKVELIHAKVLAGSINHMQKPLKEVGKSLGGEVEVFIKDMGKKGRKYEVEFLTLEIKPPKEKP